MFSLSATRKKNQKSVRDIIEIRKAVPVNVDTERRMINADYFKWRQVDHFILKGELEKLLKQTKVPRSGLMEFSFPPILSQRMIAVKKS